MTRIGIFGGSFDPLHNAHLTVVQEALELGNLERLLVVPAFQSPHKLARPGMPDALRLELLERVLGAIPGVDISDLEIRSGQPCFTVETVAEIHRLHPDSSLLFLIGSDALHDLGSWKDAEGLARLCAFLVAPRPGFSTDALPPDVAALTGLEIEVLPSTRVAISSSLVRERAAAGRGLAGFVPEAVAQAIQSSGCYSNHEPAEGLENQP
jgi:nicotinate-nucleotide adenylyltransferase